MNSILKCYRNASVVGNEKEVHYVIVANIKSFTKYNEGCFIEMSEDHGYYYDGKIDELTKKIEDFWMHGK
jgi:hypothetical protein